MNRATSADPLGGLDSVLRLIGPLWRFAPRATGLLTIVIAMGLSAPAFGDQPAEPSLDQLLKLPEDLVWHTEPIGGATQAEWRRRFQENHDSKIAAERALARSKKELAGLIENGGSWNVTVPGQTDTSNTPVSFKHREDMRRSRALIETLTRERRQLEIEADLAGVPTDWRETTGTSTVKR